ncbi:MAG: hypothetical protein GX422_15980 [Deltaproteobacteria bacterium]|nr:hypothetical protein [Deltaproteobacteria bacterium]
MKSATEKTDRTLHGIAALFDDMEKKQLFKKYLFFLLWVEVGIFAFCWLYQLGDGITTHPDHGETTFPWKVYFLVAFLAPVAITFLVGVIIVGFNKYFGEHENQPQNSPAQEEIDLPLDRSGRAYKFLRTVDWLQKLPFLSLLLLLAIAVGFCYQLDSILGFFGSVGEKSVKILLFSLAALVLLAAGFVFMLIILNYRLRKRSMEYQYRSNVAERFGLIILEDNTVINGEGKLLINGRKGKHMTPLLPEVTNPNPQKETPGSILPHPVDVESP